ncbi:MAG: hypothetical protein RLZZ362_517, partial [Actinomycetota bacterium]
MPDSNGRRRAWIAAGALVVLVLAIVGALGSSGPSSEAIGVGSRDVIVLSVPGLRWQDLEATETPHFDRWLRATALMSVRAIGNETSLVEGYLTMGSGNRVEAPQTDAIEVVGGRCVPGLAADATESADDDLNGAEPGSLGAALAEAGIATSVFGGDAAIAALMDREGCVGSVSPTPPSAVPAGVSLVELGGLERTNRAADRTSLLDSFDEAVAALSIP